MILGIAIAALFLLAYLQECRVRYLEQAVTVLQADTDTIQDDFDELVAVLDKEAKAEAKRINDWVEAVNVKEDTQDE